jgi:hypothetical protein
MYSKVKNEKLHLKMTDEPYFDIKNGLISNRPI